MTSPESPSQNSRKFNLLLVFGIFLVPVIFYWFLLRKGHDALSRTIGGLWLIVWLLPILNHQDAVDHNSTPKPEMLKSDATPTAVPANVQAKVDNPKPDTPSATNDAIPTAPPSNWRYSENIDQMRGTKTRFAVVESENSLYFDFPYSGGSTGTITIRFRPKDGLNAILQISKGQFICNSFSNDHVSIKFDNKPIQEFSCSGANDGSSNVLFIENSQKFLSEVKKSSKMIIEAPFYQAGNQQLTFSTAGLIWK